MVEVEHGVRCGKSKKRFLKEIDELEAEIGILSERLKTARKDIESIKCQKDAEEFGTKHDLEEGLVHISLW